MGWEACSVAAWPLVVQLAMDATILLGTAAVVCLAMRRASAALRHGVWTVAVVGLLILPGLRMALPDVPLRRLVLVDTSAEMPPIAATTPVIVEPAADIMTASPTKTPGSVAGPSEVADDDALAPPVFAPRSANNYADPTAELTTAAPSPHPTAQQPSPGRIARFVAGIGLVPWPGVLVGLWIAGTAWGLAMLVGMLVRTGWLLRRAVVVDDPRWNVPAVELAARLGLRRPVMIVKSDQTTIPSTAGWLRARIILPLDHARWVDDLCRAVLSHELTHVARRDVLWQTIARAVAVFYWFHPLMWFAIRRLRWEREVACDDAVLRLGERPSSYAEHLLGFAAALAGRSSLPSAVVAMATRRPIETRIRNVLRPTANRAPVGVRTVCVLIGAASLILLAVGVLRAVDVPDAIPDESSTTASTTDNAGSDIPQKDAVEPPLVAASAVEPPAEGTPLYDAIVAFNTKYGLFEDGVRAAIPPLTEDEVLAAIRWTDRKEPVTEEELQAFRKIAETKILPPGTEFEVIDEFVPNDQFKFKAWSVRIRMPRTVKGLEGWTYAFVIRQRWISSSRLTKEKRQETHSGRIKLPGERRSTEKKDETLEETADSMPEITPGPGEKRLSDAVAAFNEKARHDRIGAVQPPLTEAEVVAAIRWAGLQEVSWFSPEECREFKKIAESRLLPAGAQLEVIKSFEPGGPYRFTAWSIRLTRTAAMANGAKGWSFLIRHRSILSERIASPSLEFPKRRGPFTVELPGGATVEVLGLAEHPSGGKSWWKPDGSPLTTPPRGPDKLKHPGRVHPNDGQIAREIDVRIDKAKSGKYLVWSVPNVRAAVSGPFYTMDRGNATSRAFVVDDSRDTVTVYVDYATLPWKTIYTTKGQDSTSYTGRVDDNLVVNLEIAPAADARNGEVMLSVAHDALDYYIRVVAIGRDGKEHRNVWSTSNRGGHFGQVVTHFRNLKLNEIKSFRIECRPRRWIEFRNISLNPGHATKVEIMTSEGPLAEETPLPNEASSPSLIDKTGKQANIKSPEPSTVIPSKPIPSIDMSVLEIDERTTDQEIIRRAPKLADSLIQVEEVAHDEGTLTACDLLASFRLARDLKIMAAEPHSDREARLVALKQYVELTETQEKRFEILNEQGAVGGEAVNLLMARYHHMAGTAQLAAFEGNRAAETTAWRKSVQWSESLVLAARQSYDAGTLSLEALVGAFYCRRHAKLCLAEHKTDLDRVLRSMAAMKEYIHDITELRKRVESLNRNGAMGGEQEKLYILLAEETLSAPVGIASAEPLAKWAMDLARKRFRATQAAYEKDRVAIFDLYPGFSNLEAARAWLIKATSDKNAGGPWSPSEDPLVGRLKILKQVAALNREGARGGELTNYAYAAGQYALARLRAAQVRATAKPAHVDMKHMDTTFD
ncbi:MAG: hypothetical protein JW888_15195 [Pirellulales bacterium]|nr:hypothetical protein [Pirellulales bacterium]